MKKGRERYGGRRYFGFAPGIMVYSRRKAKEKAYCNGEGFVVQ